MKIVTKLKINILISITLILIMITVFCLILNSEYGVHSIANTRRYIEVIFFIILLIFAVITFWSSLSISRRLAGSISKLCQSAEKIGMGDFNYRIGITSNDEIGQLSGKIDQMTENLQAIVKREIAERNSVDEQIRSYMDKLERTNQALDDFAYIASHDLKEPLRGISNYSTLLLEDYRDKIDDSGKSKLKTLIRLSERSENLISALSHYSSIGRSKLSLQQVDLNKIVSEAINSLFYSIEQNHIEIRKKESFPYIFCDRNQILEIFTNLISNAIKYNNKSRKWIEIGYQDMENETHKKVKLFYIRDNGIGIKEEYKDKVFKIFKRLHGQNEFGGGTGSGLTIVKIMVERHGGKIWIESVYGEGTTFYFTIGTNKENR